MAAVESVPSVSHRPNLVVVQGRIESVEEFSNGEGYITEVKLPAQDEYESAQTIEVLSKRKFGKPGEICKQTCSLGGFVRSGKKEDGKVWRMVNNKLRAVE